jgi:hypothetical protein
MNRVAPLALLLVACGAERPATPAADTAAAVAVPADSFVFVFDSIPVSLTPGRIGTAADGSTCREHGVRVGAKLVPLLFVREAPRVDLAGHLLADLSLDCRPVATYEIDPATAQPTKWEGR